MRALFAAVLIALGIAAAQPARAADPVGLQYDEGVRAGSVLIYDYSVRVSRPTVG
jgi:hypothetical protein